MNDAIGMQPMPLDRGMCHCYCGCNYWIMGSEGIGTAAAESWKYMSRLQDKNVIVNDVAAVTAVM